jgi:hypothetical protein
MTSHRQHYYGWARHTVRDIILYCNGDDGSTVHQQQVKHTVYNKKQVYKKHKSTVLVSGLGTITILAIASSWF